MPTGDSGKSNHGSAEQRFLNYVRTGNKAIIQSLIQEYADRSYSQARRIIGGDDGAEDAVQEACLLLVNTASRYDGSVPFAAWIGQLVNSASIDYRRRLNRRQRAFHVGITKGIEVNNIQSQESVDSPEIEALRTALDSLPDRYRRPLTMHYFGGLDRNETAKALGISSSAISKQIERGIERLRAKLGRAGFAVTTAGLLTVLVTMPTYAASPEFKASLTATQRLVAVGRRVSERLTAAKVSGAKSFGLIQVGLLAVAAVTAAVFVISRPNTEKSPQKMGSSSIVLISPAQSVPGLVAHWTFDEISGTTAHDASGNGNDGLLCNGATWIPGKIGGALSLDGIDDFVEAPSSPSFNSMKGQMTVSVWVFKRSKSSEFGSIVGRRLGAEYDDLWELIYPNNETEDNYYFAINTGDRRDVAGSSGSNDVGTWVHLAATYDGSAIRLYRNALLEGSAPCAGKIPDETSSVTIGSGDNGTFGLTYFINAVIDDVRIYNRALSAAEIASLAR